MLVDFRSLEVFYWVATLRSFGRAAERLFTTQPAVSQRITALETEFGGRLLERSGRATVLTPKGRQLLDYADRLLRLRTEMIQSIAAPETVSGMIRLGVAETIVQTWLSDFIGRVSAVYPLVTFEIEVDVSPRMKIGLLRQELDLAFLMGPINEPGVVNLDLIPFPLAFVADARAGLGGARVPTATLLKHAFITFPKTTINYQQLQQELRRLSAASPRIHASASISTIIRMTLDGIGISIIPAAVIKAEVARGELTILDTGLTLPPLHFTASYVMAPDDSLISRIAQMAVTASINYAEGDKPS